MVNPMELSSVNPKREAASSAPSRKKLEESCRQFEGFFLAELMKKSKDGGALSAGEDKETYGALEETALEMSARSISEEGEGMGLWKVLYNDLCRSLAPETGSGTEPDGGEGN